MEMRSEASGPRVLYQVHMSQCEILIQSSSRSRVKKLRQPRHVTLFPAAICSEDTARHRAQHALHYCNKDKYTMTLNSAIV